MTTVTFTLIALSANDSALFIETVKHLSPSEKPIWLGKMHHWIHEPQLSVDALLGTKPEIQCWDYLYISRAPLPSSLNDYPERTWSITAPLTSPIPQQPADSKSVRSLPAGWSPSNSSALDMVKPPTDLEASLSLSSRPFGSSTSLPLKDFIRSFGTEPVAMFNLLAYLPNGGREQYFKYIAAFQESVGSSFGGEPIVLGFGRGEGVWEDVALIGYPSLWHFAAMLDSEAYMEVDRKFKKGALRDNPLMCCTPVKLD